MAPCTLFFVFCAAWGYALFLKDRRTQNHRTMRSSEPPAASAAGGRSP